MSFAPADVAWAAGLFEGEGCIHRMSRHRPKTPLLTVGMTDEDVVRRFLVITGLGRIDGPYARTGNRKDAWVWTVTGFEKVQALVAAWWPWLGARRRAKAKEILAIAKKSCIASQYRTVCPKGHPLSGDNLYIVKSRGTRACGTCLREQAKSWRASLSPEQRALLITKHRAWRDRRKEAVNV